MNKKTAVHISIYAGIINLAGILSFFGVDSLIAVAAGIIAAIMLLNLLLQGLGSYIASSFTVKAWVKQTSSALLVIFNTFVLVCGFIYVAQDGMMFFNVHCPQSREFLSGRPGFREVMFTAENGRTYHGMMYQATDEKAPLIIYFGGNGEGSYRHMRMREIQNQWSYFAGFNYLFVDYVGYGLNGGRIHYLNMYEQSLAVFDYAAALPNVDNSRIVIMGYSLGTGSAVYLAANRPVAGLILATPFARGYDLYNNVIPIFFGPMRMLVRQKLPSEEFAPYITCPVLIIASRDDEIIPFSSSERLASLFPGYVDFMILDNVRHNDIFQAGEVFGRVQSFLEGIKIK